MTQYIHIERKDWSVTQVAANLLKELDRANAAGRVIDVAEAVALTGVPIEGAREGLIFLASEIDAEVSINEHGALAFRFSDLSERPWLLRIPKRLRPRARDASRMLQGAWATAVGSLVSTTIGLMFVAYMVLLRAYVPDESLLVTVLSIVLGGLIVVAFIPLVTILLMVSFFGSFFYVVWEMGWLGVLSVIIYVPTFMLLLVGTLMFVSLYTALIGRFGDTARAFLNFGRETVGTLDHEKDFVALAATRGGRIGLGDLAVLYGWPLQRAFRELTQLMLDYGGDVEVDDEGRMVFVFDPEFGEDQAEAKELSPIWERERRPSQMFDAAARRADHVLAGIWIATLIPTLLAANLIDTDPWTWFRALDQGLQTLIVIGASLSVLMPLYIMARRWIVRKRDRAYGRREEFLRLMKRVVAQEGRLTMAIDQIDNAMLLELGGNINEASASLDRVEVVFAEFQARCAPD